MFVTLCTFDEVFQDLVGETLAWTISDLTHTALRRETYQALLPHVSQSVSVGPALELLDELRRCHQAPEWYLLQSPHRVALSDVLHRYCAQYNEEPKDFRLYQRYGLHYLEWAPMLRLFIGEPYQDGAIMAPLDRESRALPP